MSTTPLESHVGPDRENGASLLTELVDTISELRALPLAELRIRLHICRIAWRLVRWTDAGQVQSAAALLGVARTTFHRWAQVGRCFDDRLIDRLAARRDAAVVSFWHLVELSRAPRARRLALLDAVLADGLSVTQLRKHLRELDVRSRTHSSLVPPSHNRPSLRARHVDSAPRSEDKA
jgi:hypothetical protein